VRGEIKEMLQSFLRRSNAGFVNCPGSIRAPTAIVSAVGGPCKVSCLLVPTSRIAVSAVRSARVPLGRAEIEFVRISREKRCASHAAYKKSSHRGAHYRRIAASVVLHLSLLLRHCCCLLAGPATILAVAVRATTRFRSHLRLKRRACGRRTKN
jgi:hypothetical protein